MIPQSFQVVIYSGYKRPFSLSHKQFILIIGEAPEARGAALQARFCRKPGTGPSLDFQFQLLEELPAQCVLQPRIRQPASLGLL